MLAGGLIPFCHPVVVIVQMEKSRDCAKKMEKLQHDYANRGKMSAERGLSAMPKSKAEAKREPL